MGTQEERLAELVALTGGRVIENGIDITDTIVEGADVIVEATTA